MGNSGTCFKVNQKPGSDPEVEVLHSTKCPSAADHTWPQELDAAYTQEIERCE